MRRTVHKQACGVRRFLRYGRYGFTECLRLEKEHPMQHPGEVGSHPRRPADYASGGDNWLARNPTAFSQWPTAGARPRSATVLVRRSDGGVIGA